MQRINTGYFYQIGWQVHQLSEIGVQSKRSLFAWKLLWARTALLRFTQDNLIPAPLSKSSALDLISSIDQAIPPGQLWSADTDAEIGIQAASISQRLQEFEHVINAELAHIETFVTSPKGIFDTKGLVEYADRMFSDAVRSWLSEQALTDIRQAGRCLAFELPTAAGFHLARAVEESIRKYYKLVSGKPYSQDNPGRSWAKYISSLKSEGADEKVLNALDQMRDLHRNPISHPDVNLETEEAIMLMGLTQSAIVAMVTDCQRRASA